MRQTGITRLGGDRGALGIEAQRRDIIEDVRTRGEGCTQDIGLARVHRDWRRDAIVTQRLDHRNYPLDFLHHRNLRSSRARRFPADIKNVGALSKHVARPRDRALSNAT